MILLHSDDITETPGESIGPVPLFLENPTPLKENHPESQQESLGASSQQEAIIDPLLENSSFNGL